MISEKHNIRKVDEENTSGQEGTSLLSDQNEHVTHEEGML